MITDYDNITMMYAEILGLCKLEKGYDLHGLRTFY